MPKVSPLKSNFSGGKFSGSIFGRVDNERYQTGLEECKRYIPTIQGSLARCPGTYYIGDTKTAADKARLLPFEFSNTQAYIIEMGDTYARFFKNRGQIEDGGSPYEITSPFALADLFDVKYTQSADILYLVEDGYFPKKLSRISDTNWSIDSLDFNDGPYLAKQNVGNKLVPDVTMTPDATSGTVNVRSGPSISVTNCADNGSGIIRVTGTSHGFVTGDKVGIEGVAGTTEANGSWTVTKVDADNIDLDGSTFSNAYISGGILLPYAFGLNDTDDGGRWVRIKHSSTWGWGRVSSVNNYGSVQVVTESNFGGTTASSDWRLGAFTTDLGFPKAVAFHEDRLCFFGAGGAPGTIFLSKSGDYENFSPTATDGTITDDDAISATLNASKVNVGIWLSSDEKGLLAGTTGGEWLIRGATTTEALSPTNISAKKTSNYGSADIQPIVAEKSTIFAQRTGKKLREMTYFFEQDGFRAPDLTVLSEDITKNGITEMAFMPEPQAVIWSVRDDGVLLGCTYERDIDGIRAGWHEHTIGGSSDAAGSSAEVESIAIIPSQDDSMYELWMTVKRYVNGAALRHVEFLTKIFDEQTDQEDAIFLDSALTYDSPIAISGITKASPCVVTTATHGFSDGDKVRFKEIVGMTELIGDTYKIENSTSTTFELTELEDIRTDLLDGTYRWTASGSGTNEYYMELAAGGDPSVSQPDYLKENATLISTAVLGSLTAGTWNYGDNDTLGYSTIYIRMSDNSDPDTKPSGYVESFVYDDIDSSAFTTYASGGEVRKLVSTVTGLDHLEGESVDILADGAVLASETVSSGSITLDTESTTVQIGLGYNSDAKLLRMEAGSADGTALGKTRRTHRTGFLVHRSLGLKVGMSFTDLDEITFRTSSDEMDRAPELFTGVVDHRLESDYDTENQICWRQDSPLPSTILAVMPQMVTQDRG